MRKKEGDLCNYGPYKNLITYVSGDKTFYLVDKWFGKCCADLKGYVTSSQGIHGYISVMVAFKFTYLLIQWVMFHHK